MGYCYFGPQFKSYVCVCVCVSYTSIHTYLKRQKITTRSTEENVANYTSRPHKERRHHEDNKQKGRFTRTQYIKWRLVGYVARLDHAGRRQQG